MNNFTYENQGTNTYLVYHIGADEEIDSMGLGMITNNSIPGLAQTMCLQMDSEKFIKYNVSAKITVSQFFNGPVNKARLLGVFNGIVSAMIAAEDYMIDPDMILLDLDYIFADVSTCETVLVCLPVLREEEHHTDLGLFFKNIMFSTQFDQTENCDYVAKIMNHLNSMPIFSLPDFKNMIDGLMNPGSARTQTASEARLVQREIENQKSNNANVRPVVDSIPQPQPIGPQSYQSFVQPNGGQSQAVRPISVNPNNMSIPDAQHAAEKGAPVSGGNQSFEEEALPESPTGEKPMSKFYLLQHYNKENKAIYDAQQAAKKKGAAQASKNKSKNKTKNKEKAKANTPERQPAFAVPNGSGSAGGMANQGFAIPGQSTPQNAPISSSASQQPAVAPIRVQDPPKPQPIIQNQPKPQPNIQSAPVQPSRYSQMQTSSAGGNYGETVVLNGGMSADTTVLNAGMLSQKVIAPHLVRKKNGERIPVNKPVFRIGKEKSYVDYFIGDNSAISRSHANIITRDGKYYVTDTNSTNHTYLDGSILQSNSEYEIVNGSKLRFANEDFDFLLY